MGEGQRQLLVGGFVKGEGQQAFICRINSKIDMKARERDCPGTRRSLSKTNEITETKIVKTFSLTEINK